MKQLTTAVRTFLKNNV